MVTHKGTVRIRTFLAAVVLVSAYQAMGWWAHRTYTSAFSAIAKVLPAVESIVTVVEHRLDKMYFLQGVVLLFLVLLLFSVNTEESALKIKDKQKEDE